MIISNDIHITLSLRTFLSHVFYSRCLASTNKNLLSRNP